MIDELVDAIEAVKHRMTEHGSAMRENETRTRVALIDPVLSALGWDVADPSVVSLEHKIGKGKADYALLKGVNQPCAVVEAKRLGEDLGSHVEQMVGYAITEGIAYAGLTDGDIWRLYDVFDKKPLTEKCILDISLKKLPSHQSALQLLLLWYPNLKSGEPVHPAPPTVVELPTETDGEPPPGNWLRLSSLKDPSGSKPSAMRFEDGKFYELNYWYEVVVTAAEWLAESGRLAKAEMPIRAGNRIAVRSSSEIPTGDQNKNWKTVESGGGSFQVYSNLGAINCVKFAKACLERCNVSPSSVELQLRSP